MSTMSKIPGILFILVATSVSLLVIIVLYSQEQIRQQSNIIETERIVKVNQLASRIDLIITNAEKILENAAKDENIKNPPYISSIDKNLHGIPESVDKEKRAVIRNILSTYQDFETIGYILPNGDIYFVEPYDLQKTLSVSNLSFRDYYKAVTATHDTYVGSIIVSAATNHPVAPIAVPIFSENSSMVGMFSSGVDLQTIQKRLEELHSYKDEQILVVDNNKALVADSTGTNYDRQILSEIGAMQYAFAGKNGTTVESINGKKMFLAYHPIRAGQNTWAVVSMQPYDEAFQSVNTTIQESYILTALILMITGLSSYYVYNAFQARVKTLKELRKSTDQLGSIEKIKFALDESSLVAITDKNGTITYVNKKFCEVSEYTSKELIGQNHRILKSGFHPPEFYEDLWKTISSGRTWHGEIKNVSKHGKYYWVKTTIVPQLDNEGKPEQYVAIRTEITDRKNAEESLMEANKTILENEKFRTQARILEETTKAKDQFAAMMSHEIKTPIVPITGYAELLLDGTLGTLTDVQKEKIQIIYENSLRMTRLIQDMIDSYRMGLDKLKLDLKEVRCNEIINQCIDSFRPLAEKQGIRLDSKSKDVLVTCDPNRIQQVLSNLISNSIKYVVQPSQGVITISTKLDDNYLVFTVKDNGAGIPKDKQSDLFRPFYQADTSLSRKPGGTGLGMSISKGLVELHGGRIWIESEEGKGTTVHFTIPINNKKLGLS